MIQRENCSSVSITLLLVRCMDGASRSSINERGRSSSISGASTLTPNSGRNGRCILFPSLLPALIKPETVRAVRQLRYADVTGHKSRVRVQTRLHAGDDYRGRRSSSSTSSPVASPPHPPASFSNAVARSGPYKCINPPGR